MAYSEYEVVNLALIKLGVKRITSSDWTTPVTQQALDAAAVWQYVRDEVLQARDWKFAKQRATLERAALTPDYGYNYYYVLPHDFLRLAMGTKVDPSVYPTGLEPSELPVGADRELATLLSKYSWKFETVPLKTGVEKVANGTFTGAATGWTLGTGWTYGTNNVSRTAQATITTLTQAYGTMTSAPIVGEIYSIELTLSAIADGQLIPSLGGVTGDPISSTGTIRQILAPATSAVTSLIFSPTTIGMTCTIDDISVFKIEDRLVLATDYEDTEDEPLRIQYIKRTTDVTKWTPHFINALSWRLAAELSTTRTESVVSFQKCMTMYQQALALADGVNQHYDYLEDEQGSTSWDKAGR